MSYVMLAALVGLLMGCGENPTKNLDDSVVTDAVEEPASTEAEPAGEAPAMITYTIDPAESNITFGGSKTIAGVNVGTHYGGWTEYDGTVTVPEDGNLENAKIELLIDMTSLYSDDSDLTTNLVKAEGLFQIDQFPESTFTSTGIKKTEKGYDVSGNLTLRGVKKNIVFPAKITMEDGQIIAEAEFALDRQSFNMDFVNQAGDYVVDDKVAVTFYAVAKAG